MVLLLFCLTILCIDINNWCKVHHRIIKRISILMIFQDRLPPEESLLFKYYLSLNKPDEPVIFG